MMSSINKELNMKPFHRVGFGRDNMFPDDRKGRLNPNLLEKMGLTSEQIQECNELFFISSCFQSAIHQKVVWWEILVVRFTFWSPILLINMPMQFGNWMEIMVINLILPMSKSCCILMALFLEIQMTTYMIVGAQLATVKIISLQTRCIIVDGLHYSYVLK